MLVKTIIRDLIGRMVMVMKITISSRSKTNQIIALLIILMKMITTVRTTMMNPNLIMLMKQQCKRRSNEYKPSIKPCQVDSTKINRIPMVTTTNYKTRIDKGEDRTGDAYVATIVDETMFKHSPSLSSMDRDLMRPHCQLWLRPAIIMRMEAALIR